MKVLYCYFWWMALFPRCGWRSCVTLQVILAEGEKKASMNLKAAADIMSDSPGCMQIRYLQTLSTISAERNSTIIFPLPMELLSSLLNKFSGGGGGGGGGGGSSSRPPPVKKSVVDKKPPTPKPAPPPPKPSPPPSPVPVQHTSWSPEVPINLDEPPPVMTAAPTVATPEPPEPANYTPPNVPESDVEAISYL